jgi:tetratricopeptide (TPR) repeat protein
MNNLLLSLLTIFNKISFNKFILLRASNLQRMKKIFLISISILLFALNSCDTGKQLSQSKQTAQTAYENGDYQQALSIWEGMINTAKEKGSEKQCTAFTNAGMAANNLGQTEKAISYLKKATYSEVSNENTYFTLANIYKRKDNLSLELENLEFYLEKFPEGKEITTVSLRLFDLYTEIENWEKAMDFWTRLTESQKSNTLQIENYLLVNDELGNDLKCMELSNQLLKTDENNIAALKFLSSYYFWKAEKRYQKEMKIYEKKKTRKQYAILLNVIDEVAVEYKQALKYAKKLYKQDPKPVNAKLLGNTYSRLNYKDKAAYYQKLGVVE